MWVYGVSGAYTNETTPSDACVWSTYKYLKITKYHYQISLPPNAGQREKKRPEQEWVVGAWESEREGWLGRDKMKAAEGLREDGAGWNNSALVSEPVTGRAGRDVCLSLLLPPAPREQTRLVRCSASDSTCLWYMSDWRDSNTKEWGWNDHLDIYTWDNIQTNGKPVGYSL